jgi:hypothetical protein
MPELLADIPYHEARAAAIARHPASAARPARGGRPELRLPALPPFARVVDVLTGLWRVADPGGFAAAMTAAPMVAGHPVLDLAQVSPSEAGPLDSCSRGLLTALEVAAGRVLRSPGLELEWVAGLHDRHLYVETRARLTPPVGDGREAFVVAHVVEFVGAGGRTHRPAMIDHSWAVLVLGDGQGGVAGIVRATLSCPWGCCPEPGAALVFTVPAFRQRLLAPALAAQGLLTDAPGPPAEAVVLPFRHRQH